MWRWLADLFRSRRPDEREFGEPLQRDMEGIEARLAELLESTRKIARSNAKLSLRLEGIETKLEAGFADLRARVGALPARSPASMRWDDLLDALDALDRAIEAAAAPSNDRMREGLSAISERLHRVLEQGSVTRVSMAGDVPDGRMFRVVGTELHPELPDGAVVRVVRAAARSGDRTLREGGGGSPL